MDAAAWLAVIPLAVIALWALFSVGLPQDKPQQPPAPSSPPPTLVTVDKENLLMRADREMFEIEGRLRAGGLTQAAEGAALVRSRVIEFLKGYK